MKIEGILLLKLEKAMCVKLDAFLNLKNENF